MNKKSIVIIDDDEDVREILVYTLESEGFGTRSFENGQKALDYFNDLSVSEYPGLIIVDYMMPEMDGVTFIHEMRAKHQATLAKIPIALSTAMGSMEEFVLPPGIIQLYKPMELDELIKIVNEYCQE